MGDEKWRFALRVANFRRQGRLRGHCHGGKGIAGPPCSRRSPLRWPNGVGRHRCFRSAAIPNRGRPLIGRNFRAPPLRH
eukprot:8440256-Pyramimonas_sp.AAC.1